MRRPFGIARNFYSPWLPLTRKRAVSQRCYVSWHFKRRPLEQAVGSFFSFGIRPGMSYEQVVSLGWSRPDSTTSSLSTSGTTCCLRYQKLGVLVVLRSDPRRNIVVERVLRLPSIEK